MCSKRRAAGNRYSNGWPSDAAGARAARAGRADRQACQLVPDDLALVACAGGRSSRRTHRSDRPAASQPPDTAANWRRASSSTSRSSGGIAGPQRAARASPWRSISRAARSIPTARCSASSPCRSCNANQTACSMMMSGTDARRRRPSASSGRASAPRAKDTQRPSRTAQVRRSGGQHCSEWVSSEANPTTPGSVRKPRLASAGCGLRWTASACTDHSRRPECLLRPPCQRKPRSASGRRWRCRTKPRVHRRARQHAVGRAGGCFQGKP